ncbi:MAG: cysteine desulfurase family protein [Nitritalea sp.]
MRQVYADNAATTAMDDRVIEAMLPFMREHYGNPSSVHKHGRAVRTAIEKARKKVAELLHASPSEIIFTSGGTEADNTALLCTIASYGIQHVISSPIEHHAVLHPLELMAKRGQITLHLLQVDPQGRISLDELEQLLSQYPNALVSLMHGNNEIGNLLPIEEVAACCKAYGAFFHSDTVQTMGHYTHDVSQLPVDAMAAGAHKFHGPKGAGFLFLRKDKKITPFLHGGAQERNMRGGTENVIGIVGVAKALEIAYEEMQAHQTHIQQLKSAFIDQLKAAIPGVAFNGLSASAHESLYTVLSVSLPPLEAMAGMLLFQLDLHGISASGGSACSSGASVGSHVLRAIGHPAEREAVRFSFSRFTRMEDVHYMVDVLSKLYVPENASIK